MREQPVRGRRTMGFLLWGAAAACALWGLLRPAPPEGSFGSSVLIFLPFAAAMLRRPWNWWRNAPAE